MAETIRIPNLEQLQRKFSRLSKTGVKEALKGASKQVGNDVKRYMSSYPHSTPAQRSANFSFVSDKQRRWFFYALNKGLIQVPYVRKLSGGLAGGWYVKNTPSGGAIVGQRKDYGIWVQSDEFQTRMHEASGWRTDKDAVDFVENQGLVANALKENVRSQFKQAGLGSPV